MKIRRTLIYVLIDPRTRQPRYVGKTSVGINIRFSSHIRSAHRCRKTNWIVSLLKIGIKPSIEIIEEIEGDNEWQEAERFWISYFRFLGANLTNHTEGGEGLRGHIFSEDHRRKIGDKHRGMRHSEATRLKMKEAWKNRSRDHVRSLSEAQRGKPLSPEHRKKLEKHWMGRKHSEETKAKMSASMKGLKRSEQARENIRKAILKFHADRKNRISASGKSTELDRKD